MFIPYIGGIITLQVPNIICPGRYKKAIEVVEDCIVSVEKQFGPSSFELSRELLKLRDIMFAELNQLKTTGQQNSSEYRYGLLVCWFYSPAL